MSNAVAKDAIHSSRTPVESAIGLLALTPSRTILQTWVGMPLNRKPPCTMPAETQVLACPELRHTSSVTASSSEVPKKACHPPPNV